MAYKTIKVAAVALDSEWGKPKENISRFENLIETADADIDLFVLPELFSTGFVADPEMILELSEPTEGPTITALRSIAQKRNAAIAGSFLCRIGNRCYNTAFFIQPESGEAFYYHKRHLFCVSPEAKVLSAGRLHSPLIKFRGWTFSMIICYDVRFPVWCRNAGGLYDVLLVPANWPHARAYAWEHLLIARAIENQAYVVGANRSGNDDFGNYDNLSFIFNPLGMPERSDSVNEKLIVATFDMDFLNDVKRRLPVGNDADEFSIADCEL